MLLDASHAQSCGMHHTLAITLRLSVLCPLPTSWLVLQKQADTPSITTPSSEQWELAAPTTATTAQPVALGNMEANTLTPDSSMLAQDEGELAGLSNTDMPADATDDDSLGFPQHEVNAHIQQQTRPQTLVA